jgi:hypothetical protein
MSFGRWFGNELIAFGVPYDAARAFERRLRKEWGGRRVYIAKSPPTYPATPPTDAPESPRRVSTGEGGTPSTPAGYPVRYLGCAYWEREPGADDQ